MTALPVLFYLGIGLAYGAAVVADTAQNQSSCHQPPSGGGQDFQRPSNRTPATRV